jgi:DNA ligase-1
MQRFAQTCGAIAATTKKLEKVAIVADYLRSLTESEAAIAAIFFSGRPFPVCEETTLQVGGALLWAVVGELSGKTEAQLTAAYRRHGDLGAAAAEVLPTPRPHLPSLGLAEVETDFRRIAAARGPAVKRALVRELLQRASPLDAKYLIKIMTGDLRIGLKESLVEEGIAKAYGATLAAVQRANMLLGHIGETLQLAAAGNLNEARMRLFHPIGFMLASPAASAEEALSYFADAVVEDKYDGIRVQAHCDGDHIRIFSRTRDEITESFPELPDALAGLPNDAVLDGEIVAWSYSAGRAGEAGRALPFTAIQQRLGRKKVSHELMTRVPVAYVVFDVLYANGELQIDKPLRERAAILDAMLKAASRNAKARSREAQGELTFSAPDGENAGGAPRATVIRAPVVEASSPERLDELFTAAQERGNEGLMIKDPVSPYTPGRRGKSWLKLKRELATLDVVVTAAEYGHGKRVGVLSDFTFAVWDGDRLVNVGKAYSGLTDVEIAGMTTWFLEHTIAEQGFRQEVQPVIVLEVAFNNVMRSDRHESGYALRFPRIMRLRPDKSASDADTIERVRKIYEGQERKSP